jgi:hypothetical protein
MYPIGLGYKFKIGNRLYVNIEASFRTVSRDDLDAYTTSSPTMMNGISIGINDKYCYTSLGVSSAFGKKRTNTTSPTTLLK